MNDVTLMKIIKAFERLLQHIFDDVFGIALVKGLDVAGECVIHQLHKDPQSLLEIVSLHYFEHTSILTAHAHHSYLIYDDLTFHVVLWLHKLQGTNETILLSLNFENFSETALSKFANNIIEFTWVSR